MKQKLKNIKYYLLFLLILGCIAVCGCSNDGEENPETVTEDLIGTMESAEDFIKIGLYIDINSSAVANKSYIIQNNEIAIVKFTYNGLQCELRGSCSLSDMELAGLVGAETSENFTFTYIDTYPATYYTLNPGRLVAWSAGNVNYVIYTYVTTTDSVLEDIISCIEFEDHYTERQDVIQAKEEGSVEFAKQLVKIVADSDMETLSHILKYPQMIGNGSSAGNEEEFMEIPSEEIFTDALKNAINDEAVDELRMTEDGTEEYVIGTNYKNIHFIYADGEFVVTEINN